MRIIKTLWGYTRPFKRVIVKKEKAVKRPFSSYLDEELEKLGIKR